MTDPPRATLYRCTSRELAEKLPDRPDIVFTAPPLWRPRKEADREEGRMAHEATLPEYKRRWYSEMAPWPNRARMVIVLGEDYSTPMGCFGTFGLDAAAIIPWYIPFSGGRGGQMLWWCVRIQDDAVAENPAINAAVLLAAVPAHDTSDFTQHGITPPSVSRVLLEGWITPDTVVVDPFMGSGEHLIAALKLGARHVYGSEPSDFIFQTAVERLKDFADVETP